LDPRIVRFLKSQDHCRVATIDSFGFPHCVPVGFWFSGSLVYIPTNSMSVKARNLRREDKCCVIVDAYEKGKGRGVMLQGSGKLATGKQFLHARSLVERSTGWKLKRWRVGPPGKERVDTIIVFKPAKTVAIGLQTDTA